MGAQIHIIHENSEWTEHLIKRLEEQGLPYEDWFINEGFVDLASVPPEGIFYSRMSASSHTRGHAHAPELAGALFAWLEHHGRRVINGSAALRLELSKVNQYVQLEKAGIRTPRTIAASGRQQIVEAALTLGSASFITKHNRAGKGLGVRLFHSVPALEQYVDSPEFEPSIDGITLVQEYIKAPEPFITRCEFVGGKFLYAVQVDTSDGFELCPADACQIEEQTCAIAAPGPKFKIRENFSHPIIKKYEAFLQANQIEVAGIEFIENVDGLLYTYDVNTNTNYNPAAEAETGTHGMAEVAAFLGRELEQLSVSNPSGDFVNS